MDNNNSGKPRKKVTKQVVRRRQLVGLAVIALIILIFIILIANACTDKSKDPKKENNSSTTTTTTTTTTTEPVTEPPTTTTIPIPTADPNLSAQVRISTREVVLNVGESEMPMISGYPDGSSETNEIWTSTDTNIATVNEWGNITAVNVGECYVILKLDNNPAVEVQIKVNVTGTAVPENPEDVQQNPSSDTDVNNNAPNGQDYQNTQGYQDTQNYYQNPEESASQPDEQVQPDAPVDNEAQNDMQNQ